jgi:hypothetical protein
MLQSGKIGESTARSSSKRAVDSDSTNEGNVVKKPKKSKEKGKQVNYKSWPDYFQSVRRYKHLSWTPFTNMSSLAVQGMSAFFVAEAAAITRKYNRFTRYISTRVFMRD